MPKMTRSRSRNDFPMLEDMGLQACSIRGDGNCLFNALSDQIYGDQTRHAEIREGVIQYMREHPDAFKPFLAVSGGQRRNPKRKNAGALSSSFIFAAATEAETDAAYEAHLEQMARGGTWGDNIEIQAFAHAYNTDVKIYNCDSVYHVKVGPDDIIRPAAHIARHVWEHYSSIRNINGPLTGLPHVKDTTSPQQLPMTDATVTEHTNVEDWKIKAVTSLLPYLIDHAAIIKALEQNGGDISNAVSNLLDAEYISSESSTPATRLSPGSSSIERDSDSDGNEICRPSKRQNRSMEPERPNINEHGALRMEEAQSSSNLGFPVSTDSGYEGAESSQKGGNCLIKSEKALRKKQHKKRFAKLKAAHTSNTASSESEPEPRHFKSKDIAIRSAVIDTSEDTEDDFPGSLAQKMKANANFTIGEAKGEAGEAITYPSDGEADDEYRLDGEDDADSDSTPKTAVPTVRSSTLPIERGCAFNSKKVPKQTRKDNKLTKASGKLLETTIKNFNHNSIPPPIGKVAGLKVLVI